MIVVTHEIAFAREVASRMVFMDAGQIVEKGTTSDVLDNQVIREPLPFCRRCAADRTKFGSNNSRGIVEFIAYADVAMRLRCVRRF